MARGGYASLAKTRTRRKAWMPVATRFNERRDHNRAHRDNGITVKVPAGTGGTLRDRRVFDELYIFHPIRPSPAAPGKSTPADLWGRG
jgi:hypothetical protein